MARPEYLYLVDVQRTSVSVARILVRATNVPAARRKAKPLAKGQQYRTLAGQTEYEVGNVSMLDVEDAIPPQDAETAYRNYVAACAADAEFDIATLETFDSWQEYAAVKALYQFARQYLPVTARQDLKQIVEGLFTANAARVNREGLQSQIELLYGELGWQETRKRIYELVRLDEEWTESVTLDHEDEDLAFEDDEPDDDPFETERWMDED